MEQVNQQAKKQNKCSATFQDVEALRNTKLPKVCYIKKFILIFTVLSEEIGFLNLFLKLVSLFLSFLQIEKKL